MNVSHVKSNVWTKLAILSYFSSIGLGMYGMSRTKFSNDFTYNKYHFGVLVNLLSGTGLFMSAKVPSPWQSGVLFLGAIAFNSIPAYIEGMKDIRNDPFEEERVRHSSLLRKTGFYFFVGGITVLALKHRRMLK